MFYLLPAALIYVASAALSNDEAWKTGRWYLPVGCLTSVAAALLWFTAVKGRTPSEVVPFSVGWTVVMESTFAAVGIYYGAKLTPLAWAGFVLAAVGLVMVQCGERR